MDKATPPKAKRDAVSRAFPMLDEAIQLLEKNPDLKPYANAARAAAWLYLKNVDMNDRKIRRDMKRRKKDPIDDDEIVIKNGSREYREALEAIKSL